MRRRLKCVDANELVKKMRVLFTGDRNWTEEGPVRDFLATLPPYAIVIHGDGRGLDKLADRLGKERGLETIPEPANWPRYKRGAGPKRNKLMLRKYNPCRVVAFHDNLLESKGTANMVDLAQKAGLPVLLIDSEGHRSEL